VAGDLAVTDAAFLNSLLTGLTSVVSKLQNIRKLPDILDEVIRL
jgi:hypothetical protein